MRNRLYEAIDESIEISKKAREILLKSKVNLQNTIDSLKNNKDIKECHENNYIQK